MSKQIEQLHLEEVSINYGDFQAVHRVSLSLSRGEIGCLLGPSGCGKTSLLRAIAGFESVSSGTITLRGRTISDVGLSLPPEQRQVGMVFQDFALFPHLNIADNVGFGLHQLGRDQRRQRVSEMLHLVDLPSRSKAYPHELSGGQQQRIALARALAPQPDILLLDEPFSSLDSDLREQLAGEVRALLKRTDTTAILVTHDQHEAFAMADRVTLLKAGAVAQSDTPYNLYHQPADEFVAGFVGQGSMIEVAVNSQGELAHGLGRLPAGKILPGQTVRVLIRPEDVQYHPGSDLQLPVTSTTFRGANNLLQLQLADGQSLSCLAPGHVRAEPGDTLPVRLVLEQVVVFAATR